MGISLPRENYLGFALGHKARRLFLLVPLFFGSCLPFSNDPKPGPDKQGVGTVYGAMVGAGSGAVTGAQFGAGAGPGAWVGMGFGAISGMLGGLGIDALEEDQLRRGDELQCLRERAWAQEVLAEHYQRRMELHPNRDIFPADVFFEGDGSTLRKESVVLVREIARMSRQRMPWSRIVIAAYAYTTDPKSAYQHSLSERRARVIAREFVAAGIEPRRVLTDAISLQQPVLIDPQDAPTRYYQAIEFVPMDY